MHSYPAHHLILYLLILGLSLPAMAGISLLAERPLGLRELVFPKATAALLALVAIPSCVQFFYPAVLAWLMRDARLIESGQLWRILTAILVQDGGVAGTVFNLMSLAVVGAIAECAWGVRRWLVIFVAGIIAGELVALVWQPVGAGNSIANFALAGSLTAFGLLRGRPVLVLVWAMVALIPFAALSFMRNIHGAAAVAGGLTGASFVLFGRYDPRLRWGGAAQRKSRV